MQLTRVPTNSYAQFSLVSFVAGDFGLKFRNLKVKIEFGEDVRGRVELIFEFFVEQGHLNFVLNYFLLVRFQFGSSWLVHFR